MHNGKRWFLIHYKLCVLRKFSFNLNIPCSFVERWLRASKTKILYKSTPSLSYVIFSAEMITAKTDIQCSRTTYNVELGESVTVECQSHVKNPYQLFFYTVEWKSVNQYFIAKFFSETTLLGGVFTQNPRYGTAMLRKSCLKFLSFTSKDDARAAAVF